MIKRLSHKRTLGIGGLAILAVALCICAHLEPRFPGDLRLALLVQSIDSGALDILMKWVSFLTGGWRALLLVIAGGLVVWRCRGNWEAALVLATWLSSPVHSVLKLLVGRARPTSDLVRVVQDESGNSFPSGHAFFAIVFWGLLAYLALTVLQKRRLRTLVLSAAAAVVLLIGASRVYLGAHWPSDVLGGYILGALFLTGLIWLDRKWKPITKTESPADSTRADPDT